jgi:hypothetical protein
MHGAYTGCPIQGSGERSVYNLCPFDHTNERNKGNYENKLGSKTGILFLADLPSVSARIETALTMQL